MMSGLTSVIYVTNDLLAESIIRFDDIFDEQLRAPKPVPADSVPVERDIVDQLEDACDEAALCRMAASEIEGLREEVAELKRDRSNIDARVAEMPNAFFLVTGRRLSDEMNERLKARMNGLLEGTTFTGCKVDVIDGRKAKS